jgi:[methyl-Co(III) methanol-specific corrinoid protein]:coenzyme M methyltransferase
MNTKDEICDALDGNRGDQAPPAIFTQTGTVGQMDRCGACWPEANFDAEKMAQLAVQPAEMFGFAMAKVPFCVTIIPEILGCDISKGNKGAQPAVTASPWRNDDMMLVEPPDVMSPDEFLSSGRCPMILEAAEKVRSRREDLFLICGMEDAFSTAYQMTGLETFLMGAMMDPDLCRSWVEAVKPCLKAYAAALSEVSDDVQLIVESATDVMPAEMFHDFVEGSASDIVGCIKKSYSTVHSCGETSEILEDLASMGETGLSVETYYDPVGVAERIAEKVRIVGGVPPVNHLMQGTPAIIREDAIKCSDAGFAIIAPECGVPPLTPNENLMALAKYRENL